jgi:uridine kinase
MLVNIRGTNGSGKSTVPKIMYDKYHEVVSVRGDYKQPKITLFPRHMWLALGVYHNKTGGLDTLKNNAITAETLHYAWTEYPDYDIIMEGIIASTIFTTYQAMFLDYQVKVELGEINSRKILIMNYMPPVEVCIDRVYERNEGKGVKEDAIISKWKTVERNHHKFLQAGLNSIKVNTAKVERKDMLKCFVKTVEKYRRYESD